MKIKALRYLYILFLLLLTFSAFSTHVDAADKFEDNFNSYLEGTEDLKKSWEEFTFPWETKCDPQWTIENGWIGIRIRNKECQTNLRLKSPTVHLGNTFYAEFDIKLVEGSDRNFIYSYAKEDLNKGFYELHFQSPGDLTISLPKGHYILNIPGSYPVNNTFHVKLIVNKKSLQVLINGVLVKDYLANEEFPAGNIALRVGTGGDQNSETWFDNLIVSQLTTSGLEVPSMKQNEEPWQWNVYNHSNS